MRKGVLRMVLLLGGLARGIVAYLVLRLAVYLVGAREMNQMSALQFVVLAGVTLTGLQSVVGVPVSLLNATIVLVIWVGLFSLERYIRLRSHAVRQAVDGEPTILVYQGHVLEHNLYKKRLGPEELLSRLRRRNIFRLADVELAVLEPGGDLSVLRSPQAEPLTKQDMLVAGRHTGLPLELIVDGQIVYENLESCNLTEKWLRDRIRAYGAEFISEIALATVDDNLELYVDRYDDHLFTRHDLNTSLRAKPGQTASQRKLAEEMVREQPMSTLEQKYQDYQLSKAESDALPNVPQKKS